MKKLKALILSGILLTSFVVSGATAVHADMTVYDADDQHLGIYLGNVDNSTVQIYVPSIGSAIHININTGDLTGRDIYFESTDCSGTPLVVSEGAYKIIKNGSHYYAGDTVAPINIQAHSVLRSFNSACEFFSGSRYLVPAEEIDLPVELPAALPLSIEVEPRYRK